MAIKLWVNDELLDMPEDVQLTLKSGSPIFETEIERGEYTFPFRIPLTQRNSKILGFPEQVTVVEEVFSYNADLERLGSVSVGVLYIDNVGFNLTDQIGYAECTFAGTDGKFFKAIEGKKMWELGYGGLIAVPSYTPISGWNYHSNAGRFATDVTNGTITNMPFCFPMIKFKNFGLDDSGLEVLPYFVNFWQKTAQFQYDTDNRYGDIGLAGEKQRLVPMFFTKWVIEKIFEEQGFTVTAPFFADATFQAEYIPNSFSVNKWQIDGTASAPQVQDLCVSINPAEHMPDMLVADFLNTICKKFNGQFLVSGPTSYEFVLKNDIVNTTEFTEIPNNMLSPFIQKKLNDTVNAQKGINLEYTTFDTIFEENVKLDTPVEKLKGTVTTISGLAGIASPADGDIYLVKNLNQLWKYYSESSTWFLEGTNFVSYKQYKNGNDLSIDGAPLVNTNFDFTLVDYGGPTTTYHLNLPTIDAPGNFFADEWINGASPITGGYVRNSARTYLPLRFMLWFGMTQNIDGDYETPYSSGHNYDYTAAKNKIFDYNLAFYGPDGIYQTFYILWNEVMSKTTKYELQVYLPEHEVNALSFKAMIYALQQKYLLYSRAFTEPYKGVATLEVYKIPVRT